MFPQPPSPGLQCQGSRTQEPGGRVLDSNPAPPTAWGTWPSPSLGGLVYREGMRVLDKPSLGTLQLSFAWRL